MEATIPVSFDMDDGTEVEITLPVTYYAEKGYPATHEDPGCPDCICDIEFDEKLAITLIVKSYQNTTGVLQFCSKIEAIAALDRALTMPGIEDKLLEIANQAGLDYEFDRAEYLRDQREDR